MGDSNSNRSTKNKSRKDKSRSKKDKSEKNTELSIKVVKIGIIPIGSGKKFDKLNLEIVGPKLVVLLEDKKEKIQPIPIDLNSDDKQVFKYWKKCLNGELDMTECVKYADYIITVMKNAKSVAKKNGMIVDYDDKVVGNVKFDFDYS